MLAFRDWSGKSRGVASGNCETWTEMISATVGSRYWMDIDPPGTVFTRRYFGWSFADGLPEQQVQYESVRCWVCAGGQASSHISSGFRQKRNKKTFSFSPEVRLLHNSHNNPFLGKTRALYSFLWNENQKEACLNYQRGILSAHHC